MKLLALAALLVGLVSPLAAQTPAMPAEASDLQDHTTPQDPDATVPPDTAAMTPAEKSVSSIIQTDGIHIVHFWAPWCSNSIDELRDGWYELVERHPDVTFTFVTIWNDGESGRDTMERFGIPERVTEVTQPDFGPSEDKAQRRRAFLGLPVTWIPTTWVFHKNGELAYAFNYGELEMEQIDRAIAGARSSW
jgi:thiol-disulfide isomerase/thioredoxin